MEIFSDFSLLLDIAIILIPVLIAIFLIFKFVVPKKPALGIGLAIGGGLLGAFLIGRKLKNAFDVEKKLAEHNDMMAKFKNKQKSRFEAVTANKKIIEELEKQRDKLKSQGEKYQTEVDLLNAEIEDRHKLNKKILDNSNEFLSSLESRRESIGDVLSRYNAEKETINTGQPEPMPVNLGSTEKPDIQVDGFQLSEV